MGSEVEPFFRFKVRPRENAESIPAQLCLQKICFRARMSGMLTKTKKLNAIKKTAVHETDTGSSEVQVAILTKKIEELARHLKKHQKDNHSRRGLLSMVADRQTHLRYLEKRHPRRYNSLVKTLELKK